MTFRAIRPLLGEVRIMKRFAAAFFTVSLVVLGADKASADPFSLWVGADPFVSGPGVIDVTRAGAVLHTIDPFGTGEANGIAVDVTTNLLYFSLEGTMQKVNLTTLANVGGQVSQTPGGSLPEDMTFDGTNIWRTDYGLNRVERIDPATNTVLDFFTPAGMTGPVGIAWDGSGLWVGDFNLAHIEKYSTTGVDSGLGFDPSGTERGALGGLAFDPTDGSLYVGVYDSVRHYTTTGAFLGSFATPNHRFVDGLEFEGAAPTSAVPEPASLFLISSGLAAVSARRRRKPRA